MKTYKQIKIPHLYFAVNFMDMKYLKGVEIKGAAYTVVMEDGSACVFIQDIEKNIKNPIAFPIIAHEITHVLQIICEQYSMKFENEQEHMAYLMTYILNELLGYEAYNKKFENENTTQ